MPIPKRIETESPAETAGDGATSPPTPRQIAQEIEDADLVPVERSVPVSYDHVLSTGSTLLDLAISGERVRGGGVPGGIFAEFFGPEGTGKTAILSEIMTSTQRADPPGPIRIADPEGRYNQEHSRIYGTEVDPADYFRPNTVTEMFKLLDEFEYDGNGIAVFAGDSLAALSTEMEMEAEDKMGMRRAKEFSQGFRKYARKIAVPNRLLVCSNQVRDGDHGTTTTPGGRALRFYASLRVELKRPFQDWKIMRKRTLKSGVVVNQQTGVITTARVVKSSIGAPFRDAPVYIEFGYGIDDIQANLQGYKDMTGATQYGFDKATNARSMLGAIAKVEDGGRVLDLKNAVIDLWLGIQEEMRVERAPKVR